MLKEQVQHQRGKPSKERLHDITVFPRLEDLGIAKHESHRWQQIAAIPEKIFEGFSDSFLKH